MKKIVLMILTVATILSCVCLLTSCNQTPLEKAVKQADKVIAEYNEGQGDKGFNYTGELVHQEADDTYDYVITIAYQYKEGEAVDTGTKAHSLWLNIAGYFDEFENVDFVVIFQRDGKLYAKYVNDERVEN